MGKSQNEYMNHDERPAQAELPLFVAESSQLKDYNYYSQLFSSANVKMLLQDIKGAFKSTKDSKQTKKNNTYGNLDFKIAMIRAA